MQQSSADNQGFTTQQKKELTEIVQFVLKPFERKFEELELRMIRLEREMKQGFEDLKKDIDNLREDINAYRSNFVKDDERIKLLTRRVTKLEKKILVTS
jgi:hypothetical protein